MKIILLSCTLNEQDIIEQFVRHHAPLVDQFVFADDSTDQTRPILGKLADEGIPIIVRPSGASPYDFCSNNTPTRFMRLVATELGADWILHIDADELLQLSSRTALEAMLAPLPPRTWAAMDWVTYCTTGDTAAYLASKRPLYDLFRARKPEGKGYTKAIVPRDMALDVGMWPGNHLCSWLNDGEGHKKGQVPPVATWRKTDGASEMELAHLPVRTAPQIMVRELLRSSGHAAHSFLSQAKEYTPPKRLRELGFKLGAAELELLGREYAQQEEPTPTELYHDSRCTREDNVSRYADLWKYEPGEALWQRYRVMLLELADRRHMAGNTGDSIIGWPPGLDWETPEAWAAADQVFEKLWSAILAAKGVAAHA